MSAFRIRTPLLAGSPRRAVRIVRAAAVALGAAAVIVFCGCASTKAPTDIDLSGQWQLDTAASDNVEARVTEAVDRADARWQRQLRARATAMGLPVGRGRSPSSGDEMGQPGSEQVVSNPFIGPDFDQLHQHLVQILAAPSTLRLDVQEQEQAVTIQSDHLPARDYQPGEHFVRFDEFGNATVSSGWSGRAFVVHERYMSHATLTERYEVDPKSGTLTYTRVLKDPTVGNIELKSVYHQA
jgi:hypothetical protein